MMRHQDGSTHEECPGVSGDLLVTLDDATTEIYSAFFVEEEGTRSSVRGRRAGMAATGLFSSLDTDRGSHSWSTAAAGGGVDKIRLMPVPRALPPVGMTRMPASSPDARGRSARVFRTLQDRVPKERARARLTEMTAANP